MTFRVGMKAEYIGHTEYAVEGIPAPHPVFGEKYTVTNVFWVTYRGKAFEHIELAELSSPQTESWHAGFVADFFRPITDTKTEVSFTTGADPDSEQYDNRRRVAVPEWGASV